jgi:hypothetical protein
MASIYELDTKLRSIEHGIEKAKSTNDQRLLDELLNAKKSVRNEIQLERYKPKIKDQSRDKISYSTHYLWIGEYLHGIISDIDKRLHELDDHFTGRTGKAIVHNLDEKRKRVKNDDHDAQDLYQSISDVLFRW